jgi:hypothetical protein
VRNYNYILLLVIGFFSCSENTPEADTNESLEDTLKTEIETSDLSSLIRPDQNLTMGEAYSDTLVFQEYETEYDYWYARFQLSNGESIYLAYNEDIPNTLKGSTFLVEWKIDTFYEAAEYEEIYFSERMISFDIIHKADQFEGYLSDFLKAYSRRPDDLITGYIHEAEGLYSAYNPGAMCVLDHLDTPSTEKFISWDCVISDQMPEGHWCDEFEGVEEGLYYEDILITDLPEYAKFDEDGELLFSTPKLSIDSELQGLKKVQVVSENSMRRLYFFKTGDFWYFWIEDLCDCSV